MKDRKLHRQAISFWYAGWERPVTFHKPAPACTPPHKMGDSIAVTESKSAHRAGPGWALWSLWATSSPWLHSITWVNGDVGQQPGGEAEVFRVQGSVPTWPADDTIKATAEAQFLKFRRNHLDSWVPQENSKVKFCSAYSVSLLLAQALFPHISLIEQKF